ncbi:sialyltransferase [Pycnococcus provasolii]
MPPPRHGHGRHGGAPALHVRLLPPLALLLIVALSVWRFTATPFTGHAVDRHMHEAASREAALTSEIASLHEKLQQAQEATESARRKAAEAQAQADEAVALARRAPDAGKGGVAASNDDGASGAASDKGTDVVAGTVEAAVDGTTTTTPAPKKEKEKEKEKEEEEGGGNSKEADAEEERLTKEAWRSAENLKTEFDKLVASNSGRADNVQVKLEYTHFDTIYRYMTKLSEQRERAKRFINKQRLELKQERKRAKLTDSIVDTVMTASLMAHLAVEAKIDAQGCEAGLPDYRVLLGVKDAQKIEDKRAEAETGKMDNEEPLAVAVHGLAHARKVLIANGTLPSADENGEVPPPPIAEEIVAGMAMRAADGKGPSLTDLTAVRVSALREQHAFVLRDLDFRSFSLPDDENDKDEQSEESDVDDANDGESKGDNDGDNEGNEDSDGNVIEDKDDNVRIEHEPLFDDDAARSIPPEYRRYAPKYRYSACAVVGNAQRLLLENRGEEIDAMDAVFRMNQAPTKGFEMHVGSKTSYRSVNNRWAYQYRRQGHALSVEPNVTFIVTRTMRREFPQVVRAVKRVNPTVGFLLLRRQATDGAGDVLREVKLRLDDMRGKPYPGKGSPSSGYLISWLALQMCRKVTVYGVGIGGGSSWHYFHMGNFVMSREFSLDPHHSFELESDIMQMLDARGELRHMLGKDSADDVLSAEDADTTEGDGGDAAVAAGSENATVSRSPPAPAVKQSVLTKLMEARMTEIHDKLRRQGERPLRLAGTWKGNGIMNMAREKAKAFIASMRAQKKPKVKKNKEEQAVEEQPPSEEDAGDSERNDGPGERDATE